MAYVRGEVYIWTSDRLHLWAAQGDDGWSESGWAEGQRAKESEDRGTAPGGVAVPQDVADEYVVMRFAELYADGTVPEVIDRALERHAGNGGCVALTARARELRSAFERPAD